jgi:hypothetical protein
MGDRAAVIHHLELERAGLGHIEREAAIALADNANLTAQCQCQAVELTKLGRRLDLMMERIRELEEIIYVR